MIRILLIALESITYWLCLAIIFGKILNRKIYVKRLLFFIPIVYLSLFFVGWKMQHEIFICAIVIVQLIQILTINFFIKGAKISSVLGVYLLISSANTIIIMTSKCLAGLSNDHLWWIDSTVNLTTSAICIACLLKKNLCIHIKKIQSVLPKGIKVLTVISFTICAWVMSMIIANPAVNATSAWSFAMRISLVLLALFVCTTFPVLLITVLTNSHLKKQNEIFERELEAQANHYSALAKSNYELRRFRHDFSNIRIGITKSLNENDPQTALEMLTFGQNSLYQATDEIVPFDTGNGIVDAILSDKQSKAKVHNIAIHFSGSVPPAALSPVDLCVIFGNTVDNAIEACQKLPTDMKKTISISSICGNGYIFITIENPVAQTVTITNNFVSTTKENSNLHGFGLYSLNKTIKKYDGELKLTSENNTFRVNMDMCLKLSSTN